jgi:hypothetical protein
LPFPAKKVLIHQKFSGVAQLSFSRSRGRLFSALGSPAQVFVSGQGALLSRKRQRPQPSKGVSAAADSVKKAKTTFFALPAPVMTVQA